MWKWVTAAQSSDEILRDVQGTDDVEEWQLTHSGGVARNISWKDSMSKLSLKR